MECFKIDAAEAARLRHAVAMSSAGWVVFVLSSYR